MWEFFFRQYISINLKKKFFFWKYIAYLLCTRVYCFTLSSNYEIDNLKQLTKIIHPNEERSTLKNTLIPYYRVIHGLRQIGFVLNSHPNQLTTNVEVDLIRPSMSCNWFSWHWRSRKWQREGWIVAKIGKNLTKFSEISPNILATVTVSQFKFAHYSIFTEIYKTKIQ